jgi:hypothetical protein
VRPIGPEFYRPVDIGSGKCSGMRTMTYASSEQALMFQTLNFNNYIPELHKNKLVAI